MSEKCLDPPVRPMRKEQTPGAFRKLWGLEDEDDVFKDNGEWTESMQRDFEESRAEEQSKRERERDQMINWYEKYENNEENEEAEVPKYKSSEPKPSKREVEEHMLTHVPFRTWCPHCVRGKERAAYHKG